LEKIVAFTIKLEFEKKGLFFSKSSRIGIYSLTGNNRQQNLFSCDFTSAGLQK
jgi:hypothetical protein